MYVYVSNIFTCICHTLVPEIHVRHEMLCVFWYIYVLMCMITEKQGPMPLAVCREDYQ